ncbi:hypothetical protein [Streptomyces spinosus]|uniref:hypothetical protein n=1 Tax=Streptomyces spinosus TaxID=2872623 RepID=UPI001CEDD5D8|nr:hypothetical protein [Streptomyces spinosus]
MTGDARPGRRTRTRFEGWIVGTGTASGTRVVLGHWGGSPFGRFSDVMVERADGHRLLLAPSRRTADFIAATYSFDDVEITPVTVRVAGRHWQITAGPLDLRLTTGPRGPMGRLLRAVPAPLAARPAWTVLTYPPARLLLGVRTRGSAGGGRREWYGALDLLPVVSATTVYDGRDQGPLAPVAPPVRFGFGSTPRAPSAVRVVTTVELPRSPGPRRGPATRTS